MTTTQVHEARIQPAPFAGAGKNLIANGAMSIWQRGAGSFSVDNAFSADEWQLNIGGTATMSVLRSTTAQVGTYSLEASFTNTASDVGQVRQAIDCWHCLEGRWVTASAWVQSSSTNARLRILDYNGSSTSHTDAIHSGSGSWERLTVAHQMQSTLAANTGWPHDVGAMVELYFSDTAANVRLDGVMVVPGYYPEGIPFVPMHMSEEWDRVQRYYEEVNYTSGTQYVGHRVNSAQADVFEDGNYYNMYRFQTRKHAVPTVTISGYGEPSGETTTVFSNSGAYHDEWKFRIYDDCGGNRDKIYLRAYFRMHAEVL